MAGRIVIGTSSWADPGFVAEWYPKGMPARDRLAWYAERFEAVELNSSFYALPDRTNAARWVEQTPSGFEFEVKLHRLLSGHSAPLESLPPDLRERAQIGARGRVLRDPGLELELLERLREEVAPLAEAGRLRSFLLQLSPAFSPAKSSLDELHPIIAALAPYPVAVELRNRHWVDGERAAGTLDALTAAGATFVCVDAPAGSHFSIMPALDAVTRDDLAYVRLHGRNSEGYLKGRTVAERFGWVYSDAELEEIAVRVQELAGMASDVRVMFNNNRGADAPVSARCLRELLGQDPGPAPEPAQGTLL